MHQGNTMKKLTTAKYAFKLSLCMGIAAISLTHVSYANEPYFSHQDWEIACDNTGTCRAAGYQKDEDELPVSILLTRQAGAKQTVTGEFILSIENIKGVHPQQINLYLNNKNLGLVKIKRDQLNEQGDVIKGQLSATQTQALIESAKQKSKIEFKTASYVWKVSDQGMSAILFKMDDAQKRVGTIGALIKKGAQSERQVLAPTPAPVVHAVKIPNQKLNTIRPASPRYQSLAHTLLAAVLDKDQCDVLLNRETWTKGLNQDIEVYALNQNTALVSSLCWSGAYNQGYGYWLIDRNLTGKATLITTDVSDYDSGQISAVQRGRGIGDCMSFKEWVWNGKTFIQTRDGGSGMCKMIAPGGAWDLKNKVVILR